MFGGFTEQMADPEDMSEDRIEMFGGAIETLDEGYLGVITLFTAVLAAVMVTLGMQSLRSEETKGRSDPVLATATSRWAWTGSHLAVLSIGLTVLLAAVGFVTGLGAALSLGDGSLIGSVTAAHLAHVPGVLVLLGLTTLLVGVAPRAIGATWAVLAYSLFIGLFGTVSDHPQWVRNLVPMEHTGQPPLDGVAWPALAILLAVAAALAGAGMAGFRRRDLDTR
jgi:ABC-2 type transport system permease protein